MTATSPRKRAFAYIFKLLMLTVGLSIAVKYGGEYLPLPPQPQVAIAMILTPAIIVGIRLAIVRL